MAPCGGGKNKWRFPLDHDKRHLTRLWRFKIVDPRLDLDQLLNDVFRQCCHSATVSPRSAILSIRLFCRSRNLPFRFQRSALIILLQRIYFLIQRVHKNAPVHHPVQEKIQFNHIPGETRIVQHQQAARTGSPGAARNIVQHF